MFTMEVNICVSHYQFCKDESAWPIAELVGVHANNIFLTTHVLVSRNHELVFGGTVGGGGIRRPGN